MTKNQALYLCDRLFALAEDNKEHSWNEIRKGFKGPTEDYLEAITLLNQIHIYRSAMELKLPAEWLKYKEILNEPNCPKE